MQLYSGNTVEIIKDNREQKPLEIKKQTNIDATNESP